MDPDDDDLRAALPAEALSEIEKIRAARDAPLQLWKWWVRDEVTGKRRLTSYRMSEQDARERFGDDAVKDEASREVRQQIGSASEVGNRRH